MASQFIDASLKERVFVFTRKVEPSLGSFELEMDPYAKPNEKKTGTNRPRITHLPGQLETRTKQQRQAEKQAVAAERRAIKKAARRELKQQLEEELQEEISKSETMTGADRAGDL